MNKIKQRILVALGAFCINIVFGATLMISAQTTEIRTLTTGQVIERELRGDETHSYSLVLNAGQFLHIVIEQKDIDVVIAVFDPNNEKLAEVDTTNEKKGSEHLLTIVEVGGNYHLKVYSQKKNALVGRYEIKIKELRNSTEIDKKIIAAQRAFSQGRILKMKGTVESTRNAVTKYEEALIFYRLAEDRNGLAKTMNYIGQAYSNLGEQQKALDYYSQALPLWRDLGNKEGEETTLNSIGSIYSKLNEKQKALKYYEEALALMRSLGNKAGEVNSMNNIASLYNDLGERGKALEYYEEALALTRLVGNKVGEANSLQSIGGFYIRLSENQKALDYYFQALTLWRKIGSKIGEIITLNSIGAVYGNLGEQQKSLDYFALTLTLWRKVGDKEGEATSLNNIGAIYNRIGEWRKALEYYEEALALTRLVGDKAGEAVTLHELGVVNNNLGEWRKSLEYYEQALPIRRAVGNKAGEAATLRGIGTVYNKLGEWQKALEYFEQALALTRSLGNKAGEANSLQNIAGLYNDLGEWRKSLEYYEQALPIRRAVGNKAGEAATLRGIGTVYNNLGEWQKALEYFEQALPLFRASFDKAGEAATLQSIGAVYSRSNEHKKALEYFAQALPIWRVIANKQNEASLLAWLGVLMNKIGNRPFAIVFDKSSVNHLQELRSNIAALDKNTQQTYLKSKENAYYHLVDILITEGRLAEAQQTLNSFKNQQLFDFEQQGKQVSLLSLTKRENEFITRFNNLADKIGEIDKDLVTLRRIVGGKKTTEKEQSKIREQENHLEIAKSDFLAFLEAADKEFHAPPDSQDKEPAIADLQSMQATLRETSMATKENTVAVYTMVGEQNYRALVVTANTIFSASYPIKRTELNQKALQLWKLLRTPDYDPQLIAEDLYKIIFAPFAAKLPKDTKTILWSLDGNLRYVPMAALSDGKQYLVERFNNVIFTRVDRERLTRNVSSNWTGTGFGSSKNQTAKLFDTAYEFQSLLSVKTELYRIIKNAKPNGIFSGEILLDSEFTKPAMIDTLKKRRPLVHIASHFKFEPGDEARSFLLMGDGSPFTLDEMKTEKDLFGGVELLTLSACQTAAQRPDANGREVDGFAELAQRLGAGAIMASLWELSDDSTAELMTRFYQIYSTSKTNKAEALRKAQLALLRGDYREISSGRQRNSENDQDILNNIKIDKTKLRPYKSPKNAPFAHPFYWSPFVLFGNWK